MEAIKLRIASSATRADMAQQVVLHPSAQGHVRVADTRCQTQERVRLKVTVSRVVLVGMASVATLIVSALVIVQLDDTQRKTLQRGRKQRTA